VTSKISVINHTNRRRFIGNLSRVYLSWNGWSLAFERSRVNECRHENERRSVVFVQRGGECVGSEGLRAEGRRDQAGSRRMPSFRLPIR
jgi:hypothetical protein